VPLLPVLSNLGLDFSCMTGFSATDMHGVLVSLYLLFSFLELILELLTNAFCVVISIRENLYVFHL